VSEWSLDALAAAAQAKGIQIGRRQVRRILRQEGVRWRRTPSWTERKAKDARPTKTAVVACSTDLPDGSTTLCLDSRDELGPLVPRTFPPAPGWSPSGHRIKAPMEDGRGDEQVWVYGALRVRDGQEVTFTAPSRNTAGDLKLLTLRDTTNPDGELHLVSDTRSSHTSGPIQEWLGQHPRVHPVPIPTGACWLNQQEGWGRILRREAFAGQSFADARGDRPGDAGGDRPSQCAGQALGLGPPASTTAHASSSFCVSTLRNGALLLQLQVAL
jgi:hypothetical protein